jgi:hypothetical protein
MKLGQTTRDLIHCAINTMVIIEESWRAGELCRTPKQGTRTIEQPQWRTHDCNTQKIYGRQYCQQDELL